MRTPLDEALARIRRTEGRLELEAQFADVVMGSDPSRWEMLAMIAALPEPSFVLLKESLMGFSFSKFAATLTTLLPIVTMLVPGGDKLAPYVPTILAGIAAAEKSKKTGAEKKAYVQGLVASAADALAIATPGKTDKDELLLISGNTVDAVIGTIHAIEKAHAALPALPGLVEKLPSAL